MSKTVKYLFAALIVGACLFGTAEEAVAQHYVGIKGGYGAAMGRFYPKRESAMFWGCYTGGLAWKYYSATQVLGGISAELEYQDRGFMYYYGNKTDSTVYEKRTVTSLTIPFMWQPHLYFFNRKVRFFLNAGITFTYNMTSRYESGTKRDGIISSGKYEWMTARDCRWGYGLCGGVGLSVLVGRFDIGVEGRYYYGFSDILRNRTKYSQNPLRSELDNLSITFAVFYRLGKGGIKAPPLRKRPARAAERKADRNEFTNIHVQQ